MPIFALKIYLENCCIIYRKLPFRKDGTLSIYTHINGAMPQAGIDPPAQSHASTPKPPRLDPSTFIDGLL